VRWPRKHDPLRSQIRRYGESLAEVHRSVERRIRWPLDPEAEWWTLVGLRSAAAGAAVGLGEYRQSLHRSGQYGLPALAGLITEDPGLELAVTLHDRDAMRGAYRVLLWAYNVEINVELWGPRYWTEVELAAAVIGLDSGHERAVVRGGDSLKGAPARDGPELARAFRCNVLTGLLRAATGSDFGPQHPAWEAAAGSWLNCYARGREAAATELKRLAPYGLPTLTRA
jgi:hypothetical protein